MAKFENKDEVASCLLCVGSLDGDDDEVRIVAHSVRFPENFERAPEVADRGRQRDGLQEGCDRREELLKWRCRGHGHSDGEERAGFDAPIAWHEACGGVDRVQVCDDMGAECAVNRAAAGSHRNAGSECSGHAIAESRCRIGTAEPTSLSIAS